MTAMADWQTANRAFERAVDMAARLDADAHTRLVLAYKTHLVRLAPDALPPPARARFLRLHEALCGWPPGDPARDYTAHFRALYPEQAADLLAQLVELKNAVRLLLEEHDA
jgi:hypothetical protein